MPAAGRYKVRTGIQITLRMTSPPYSIIALEPGEEIDVTHNYLLDPGHMSANYTVDGVTHILRPTGISKRQPEGCRFEKPRPSDRVVLFETGTKCRFQMPTGLKCRMGFLILTQDTSIDLVLLLLLPRVGQRRVGIAGPPVGLAATEETAGTAVPAEPTETAVARLVEIRIRPSLPPHLMRGL